MKPPYSPVPSLSRSALPDCWNCACALVMLRSVAIAAVSLADRRAARRFGMAIAAMMAMIAITIISSIRVKPDCLRDIASPGVRGWLGPPAPTMDEPLAETTGGETRGSGEAYRRGSRSAFRPPPPRPPGTGSRARRGRPSRRVEGLERRVLLGRPVGTLGLQLLVPTPGPAGVLRVPRRHQAFRRGKQRLGVVRGQVHEPRPHPGARRAVRRQAVRQPPRRL